GNNSAGEKTLRYGQTKDFVCELKVVFSDGTERVVKPVQLDELNKISEHQDFVSQVFKQTKNLIEENKGLIEEHKPKTSKNSAGYYIFDVWKNENFDLNQLITGSQGTLGMVTEITFKLRPVAKKSKLVVILLKDLAGLGDLINLI